MSNPNARDMFANTLSVHLIEVCKETGYYKVGDQKEKIKRDLTSKYGFFSYKEDSLPSFMAGAAEAIQRLFPDSITASIIFSFHEKSLFDTFNKLKKLTEKEKALEGLVKAAFLGSATLENFKTYALSLVKDFTSKTEDIENLFRLHNSGELDFIALVGSIVNALRENQDKHDWLGKSINIYICIYI